MTATAPPNTTTSSATGLATPPDSPSPALSKSQILTNVISLAGLFSTCVEAFNLIHPDKASDHDQKVALARLGLQQGRLLIFGDAVGISSPPATIAKHMIPSHPGITNPDPSLPVNFGVRDPKLDEKTINDKVRAALDEIAGRPAHLSREELMEKYGLKSPKRFTAIEYPALDTNRLEAFREKYALLNDLARQTGVRGAGASKRGMSMSISHWTVRDVDKFASFVSTVRLEVDGLIALLGVKEQVDRGMKTDIRAMGWHPDLSGPVVRSDWEKLRLIRDSCVDDYPEYVSVCETALKYISEELKGTSLANMRAAYPPPPVGEGDGAGRRKSSTDKTPSTTTTATNGTHASEHGKANHKDKDKRPGFLSFFKYKSWSKSHKDMPRERSKSIAGATQDPPRSMSEGHPQHDESGADGADLSPVRSKSLSAVPDEPAPFDLASRLESAAAREEKPETNGHADVNGNGEKGQVGGEEVAGGEEKGIPIRSSNEANRLTHADTANSLIDRHDMFKGVGRVETKDVRANAHDWAS